MSESAENPPPELQYWRLGDADLFTRLSESECRLRQTQADQLAMGRTNRIDLPPPAPQ